MEQRMEDGVNQFLFGMNSTRLRIFAIAAAFCACALAHRINILLYIAEVGNMKNGSVVRHKTTGPRSNSPSSSLGHHEIKRKVRSFE